jgi:type IV secretory pathway VirB2 component (pilin)
MLQNVLAPNLIKIMAQMHPSVSISMPKQSMQKKLPTIIQGSFAIHILFGVVLGIVTQILYSKSRLI